MYVRRTSWRATRSMTEYEEVPEHAACSHSNCMTDELCCILTLMTSRGVTKSDVRIAPEHADSAVSAGVMITLRDGNASSSLGVMEVAWLVGKAKDSKLALPTCRC